MRRKVFTQHIRELYPLELALAHRRIRRLVLGQFALALGGGLLSLWLWLDGLGQGRTAERQALMISRQAREITRLKRELDRNARHINFLLDRDHD